MRNERRRSHRDAIRPDGEAIRARVVTERPARDDRPAAPAAAETGREPEHRPSVEAERTPAHIPRRRCPRYPGRTPRPSRNPVPTVAAEPPSAVVMRRPRPEVHTDPRPAPGPVRRPITGVVRLPVGRHRRIPRVSVRRGVFPRPVSIQRAAVHLEILRQVLR